MNTPDDVSLHARFSRGLRRSPDRAAIRVGSDVVTFRDMHERALRWSAVIVEHANQMDRRRSNIRVGVLTDKGVTTYLGVLAVLYAGATVVPLHPGFPAGRTRAMLDAAEVTALIVDDAGLRAVSSYDQGRAGPYTVWTPDVLDSSPHGGLTRPRTASASDDAYALFTSGSTGRPKGVPISHGSVAHYFDLIDSRYDFAPTDVFSQTFDINFDCAMFDLFCAWGAGASVIAIPPHAYRDIPAFLTDHGVSIWFSTPSAISLVRRTSGLAKDSMPTVRWSFFAGEALRCDDVRDWICAASSSVVENLYGPTELTVTIAAHRWDEKHSIADSMHGLVPIGRIHDGHSFLVLDADGAETDGEGELLITGPQATRGYLDPSDDRGRFIERSGARWYRTGDRVRVRDSGELIYVGRLDAQVQVQGWRVELAEVDEAVRTCTGVDDAVTVARNVDGQTELVVFYTGNYVKQSQLARHAKSVLPEGMLPRHFERVDEFPLNSNRKVDRRSLTAAAHDLSAKAAPTTQVGQALGSQAPPADVAAETSPGDTSATIVRNAIAKS